MIVRFVYSTGIPGSRFTNPILWVGWDGDFQPSETGTTLPMRVFGGGLVPQEFSVEVEVPDARVGTTYRWGVRLDGPGGQGVWAIVHEVPNPASRDRYRTLTLRGGDQEERYYLSRTRRLGANKRADGRAMFAVWAPNAEEVRLVFGEAGPDRRGGYIADDGTGIAREPIPMTRRDDGVWTVDGDTARYLANFAAIDHQPYMYQIRKKGAAPSEWSYRTDLYSRCQIGKGSVNPEGAPYSGRWTDLGGSISCSVVVDPDRVTRGFSEPDWPETQWVGVDEFWANEFDPARPLPRRLEDLVIYELHIGGLGFHRKGEDGENAPGTLEDAMALLDYLVDLGVNAIELLPMSEFDTAVHWGYATSHYFGVEFSGGGRDQMKHFVRACHRRGIAVLLDVVYNHYTHSAERAQWMYDTNAHEENMYFWYEGRASDYGDFPTGGYVDNMSTAWAPRFWEEEVRSLFASSALALVTEFHFDGFRVDQTTSIHAYNRLHLDGRVVGNANALGGKMLREWTNAVRLVAPQAFLIAEDHSGWDAVTRPTDEGGLGFDSHWYADFYHHLAGDTGRGSDFANLLTSAARQSGGSLAMSLFARVLATTNRSTVVYHESHDEAGNSEHSGRTIAIAVNRAPLIGDTRRYAEARSRFAAGMTLLSAGIPMFFMGEEVGFSRDYTYDGFVNQKEDFLGMREGVGAGLFAFYRALIRLRLDPTHPELRDGGLEVLHVNDEGRTIAFLRRLGERATVVVATLSDSGYPQYDLDHPAFAGRSWVEVLTSDESAFGGWGTTNGSVPLTVHGSRLTVALPRAGFVVLTAS